MPRVIRHKSGGAITEVTGLPNVMNRLRDRLGRFIMGAIDGNYEAGRLILREANELVPVDTGNLRSTGFVKKKGLIVTIGYSASYAMLVHEVVENAHGEDYNTKYATEIATGATYTHTPTGTLRTYHKRRPQEQAKFLEVAVRRHTLAARNTLRKTTVKKLLATAKQPAGSRFSGAGGWGALAQIARAGAEAVKE